MIGAPERRRPAHVAVAGAERVEVAVLAAEVDGAVDDQRRGLRPAGQALFPDRLPRFRVELDDVAGNEVDDVEAPAAVGGRRGVEGADPPLPDLLAGVGVERDGVAAVVDEEEPAGGDHRRELEQRMAGVAPEVPEGRPHPFRRQVAGAGAVIAVERPGHGLFLDLLFRLFRLEDGVFVVDVGGPLQRLVGDRRAGDREDDDRGDGDAEAPVLPPEPLRVPHRPPGRGEPALALLPAAGPGPALSHSTLRPAARPRPRLRRSAA